MWSTIFVGKLMNLAQVHRLKWLRLMVFPRGSFSVSEDKARGSWHQVVHVCVHQSIVQKRLFRRGDCMGKNNPTATRTSSAV
jgi:hypothetical protein